MRRSTPRLPRTLARLFRALLPLAERDEVMADLETEFRLRTTEEGERAARRWAWRQLAGSVPALAARGWWRGMTGFEPGSSRMRPGGPMFETWIMDARYTIRRLRRRPTYAALAILTLALGAGGTAAVYSIVRSLLLDPLPIARESEVGVLWFDGSWTEQEFVELRPDFPGFRRMAAYRPNDLTLDIPGAPLRLVPGIAASAELFDVLEAPPMMGRTFRAGEDQPGTEFTVVISHSLWRELGSDPQIIGKPFMLGGVSRTVAGVMPPGFWFPSPETQIWSSAKLTPQNRSGMYTLVGRAADGVDLANMQGQLGALAAALGSRYRYPAQWDKTKEPAVTPAREFFVGDVRPALVATLVAMALILLIACANVAALMLGQVDARSTEIALRAALGANRQRLVQQLLLEALLIGLAAGIAGAVFAAGGFNVLVDSLPLGGLADNVRLDWGIFGASIGASLVAALLIAFVPGIALWRGSSIRSAIATTRTGGIAGRGGRLEGGLVIAQMALAVLLAAGAGLLIRSVANLRGIDPGVDVSGLAVVDTTMPLGLTPPARLRVVLDTITELESLPGVTAVGASAKIPLRGSGDNWGIRIQGKPEADGTTTAFRMVSRNYLPAMGLEIRKGRGFDPSDRADSDPVVVINEALAAKYFPNEDPIGRILMTGFPRNERIIGVVENAAEADLQDPPVPARYMLIDQLPTQSNQMSFVLRTPAEAQVAATIEAARSRIAREGSRLAIQETTSMQHVFDLAVGPAGQVVTLLSLLAGLALVLGAIGVYGVISHYVTRRSRDYGICLALGERPARVIRQVVLRGASLVALGSAIGIVAALFLTKLLAALLYGVEATDPLAMASAVGVLLIVGMLAAFVPARRASRLDPMVILRES